MLLNILKGAVLLLATASMVTLVAALIEERVTRSTPKDPDYRLALGLLKLLTYVAAVITLYEFFNYSFRLYNGLPGSTAPGPESNSIVSLVGLALYFALTLLMGMAFARLLWQAQLPDQEEIERRRRMARARLEAERRRAARRRAESEAREGLDV